MLNFFFILHQGTPIHWAAGKGHFDTMKYLFEKGASINIKDEYGVIKVLLITVCVTLVPTTSQILGTGMVSYNVTTTTACTLQCTAGGTQFQYHFYMLQIARADYFG